VRLKRTLPASQALHPKFELCLPTGVSSTFNYSVTHQLTEFSLIYFEREKRKKPDQQERQKWAGASNFQLLITQ